MILGFADEGTRDIFNGLSTKAARRTLPASLHANARRKLDIIDAAHTLEDLKAPPGNRLEALKGRLAGKWSIRINDQYRVVFSFDQASASEVQITDYH